MKISPINNFRYSQYKDDKKYTRNLSTIPFGSMKKSDFSGIDLFVVENEKSPIEKFNSNEDFQKWSKKQIFEIFSKDYDGRKPETKDDRYNILYDWMNFFYHHKERNRKGYSSSVQLMALRAITSELKISEDKLPPIFNRDAFAATIDEINTRLKDNPKDKFSFNKIYRKNLFITLGIENKSNPSAPQWIYIPSKLKDPEHYEDNLKKMKATSDLWWCTAYNNSAKFYLEDKDMHIYVENLRPKVAIVTDKNNVLYELQSRWNNHIPPIEYMDDVVYPYMKEKNIDVENSKWEYRTIEEGFKHQISTFHKTIDENNIKDVLNYFGIQAEKDEKDGLYVISHYDTAKAEHKLKYFKHFEDYGIDENDLFKYIKEIKDYANFTDSNVTDLGSLKKIGGNCSFSYSKIKDLGQLEYIGGSANFKYSLVLDLGKLKEIGKDANFENSIVNSLGDLKKIGGEANFNCSLIETLDNLEEVGGILILALSNVTDFGKLRKIGYALVGRTDRKEIKHCENLKYIGEGGAILANANDYKKLKQLTKGKVLLVPIRNKKS